jgi:hypothetical protein
MTRTSSFLLTAPAPESLEEAPLALFATVLIITNVVQACDG